MSFKFPHSIQFSQVTTNAVANTATTTTLLAAVANKRYRVIGYKAHIRRDVTGIIDTILQDGAGGAFGGFAIGGGAAVSAVNSDSGFVAIPYPGYLLPINSAMQIITVATVATQVFKISIHYFLDSAT